MKNRYIASFEAAQIASKEVPAFRAGDTLRLGVEIKEGEKKRVQTFYYRDWETDRKSTRLNSSHRSLSRMPSSA